MQPESFPGRKYGTSVQTTVFQQSASSTNSPSLHTTDYADYLLLLGIMTPLPLTFAAWEYDRTRALQDGRVRIEGVDLNYFNFRFVVSDIQSNLIRNQLIPWVPLLQSRRDFLPTASPQRIRCLGNELVFLRAYS
jgi:hypothetical protein